MKRLLCLLCALCLLALSACQPDSPVESSTPSESESSSTSEPSTTLPSESTDDSTEPAPVGANYELGEPKAVTYLDAGGAVWAMGFAEVKNTGDQPLLLGYGEFELASKDGQRLTTIDTVSAFPQVILPGESGYYFEVVETALSAPDELKLLLKPDIQPAEAACIRYEITESRLRDSPYGGVELLGAIQGGENAPENAMACVAALLFDANGAFLGLVSTMLIDSPQADAEAVFAAQSFKLPGELKASDVAETRIYAYPLLEQ